MTNQIYKQNKTDYQESDVVIIGGGLAGLAAAILLARRGKSVTIIEKSTEIGGRARTIEHDGFYFNHGPHALFPAGPGAKTLQQLNINYKSEQVKPEKYYAIKDGKKHHLPLSLGQLLGTQLIKGLRGKIEAIKFFSSLNKMDLHELQGTSLQKWLDKKFKSSDVKGLIKMLSRLATYSNDAEFQSAGLALSQIKIAMAGGVNYVDEGWQTLVNGLVAAAKDMNVKLMTGKKVISVENNGVTSIDSSHRPWSVILSDGNVIT